MTEQNAYPRFWRVAVGIALVLFFAALAFSLTMPITDPDFWWHLASGRWMWQERSLLQTDPFMIPYQIEKAQVWTGFILKQYWLSQLISYGIYSTGGFHGIIILRAMLATAMFFCLYRLMRHEETSAPFSLGLVFLATLVIVNEFGYVGDKPQLWTSFFAVLALWLLSGMEAQRRWTYWALPPLMLIWANLHGGYIFGIALICTYGLGVAVSPTRHRGFFIASLAGIVACGLNPNGFTAVRIVLSSLHDPVYREYLNSIVESQSIFTHASLRGIILRLPFFFALFIVSWAATACALPVLWKKRRAMLFPFVLISVMNLISIRYIIFFTLYGSLMTAISLNYLAGYRPLVPVARAFGRWTSPAVLLVALTCAGLFTHWGITRTALADEQPFENTLGGAVAYVQRQGLKGNLFNDYNSGGYLTWWLYPQIRISADPRNLYPWIFPVYRTVADTPLARLSSASLRPAYEEFLDSNRIDLVLMSGCDPVSGVPIWLTYALREDPRWALIYADNFSLLFMRSSTENREFLKNRELGADAVFMNMIALASQAASNPHARMVPGWRLSLAIGYQGIGDREKALFFADEYLKIRPADGFALQLRSLITSGSFALP